MELINGLVSLVHQTNMIDVAQEAMEALLVLHQPEKIEMWNPEAPINTFWDVRLVLLISFLIIRGTHGHYFSIAARRCYSPFLKK